MFEKEERGRKRKHPTNEEEFLRSIPLGKKSKVKRTKEDVKTENSNRFIAEMGRRAYITQTKATKERKMKEAADLKKKASEHGWCVMM